MTAGIMLHVCCRLDTEIIEGMWWSIHVCSDYRGRYGGIRLQPTLFMFFTKTWKCRLAHRVGSRVWHLLYNLYIVEVKTKRQICEILSNSYFHNEGVIELLRPRVFSWFWARGRSPRSSIHWKKTRGTEKIYAQVVNIAYNFKEEGLKRCYSPAREFG